MSLPQFPILQNSCVMLCATAWKGYFTTHKTSACVWVGGVFVWVPFGSVSGVLVLCLVVSLWLWESWSGFISKFPAENYKSCNRCTCAMRELSSQWPTPLILHAWLNGTLIRDMRKFRECKNTSDNSAFSVSMTSLLRLGNIQYVLNNIFQDCGWLIAFIF